MTTHVFSGESRDERLIAKLDLARLSEPLNEVEREVIGKYAAERKEIFSRTGKNVDMLDLYAQHARLVAETAKRLGYSPEYLMVRTSIFYQELAKPDPKRRCELTTNVTSGGPDHLRGGEGQGHV